MSEQPESDDAKEPLKPEQEKPEVESRLLPVPHKADSTELSSPDQLKAAELKLPSHADETEWIPGEQLELVRIPHPTVWPVTLALGITGMAFGVVTQWILSVAGLFLY